MLLTCLKEVVFQTLDRIQNTLKFFLLSLRLSRDQSYWHYDGEIRIRSFAIVRDFLPKRPGQSWGPFRSPFSDLRGHISRLLAAET
jgi:hypothetical protein